MSGTIVQGASASTFAASTCPTATTHVLKDIDLSIRPGEFFAFLGPSGCGKTTLLRLIAGFAQAQTGQVLLGGQDVAGLPPWKRDVGMVFQSYALWPHMTVAQNVAFGLEERRLPRAEIDARVAEALELVGLAAYAERRPAQLSGGQQQRVARRPHHRHRAQGAAARRAAVATSTPRCGSACAANCATCSSGSG